jgi:hypothetical protein
VGEVAVPPLSVTALDVYTSEPPLEGELDEVLYRLKVTVPVGVPEVPDTVAESCAEVPLTDGVVKMLGVAAPTVNGSHVMGAYNCEVDPPTLPIRDGTFQSV